MGLLPSRFVSQCCGYELELFRKRKQMNGTNPNSFDSSSEESTTSFSFPSIRRVPEILRHVNEEAYSPKVVSIGPLHHGMEKLSPMEEHKKKYLDDLIRRTERSKEAYETNVRQMLLQLHDCYEQPIGFEDDQFVEIILVDAAFIILFLLKLRFLHLREQEDPIFGNPHMLCDICRDLLLFENQLPLFVLNDLFERCVGDTIETSVQVHILMLLHYFFKELMQLEVEKSWAEIRPPNIKHLVDFLRCLHLPLNKGTQGEFERLTTPNITMLHQSGVRFQVRWNKNLLDLKFENGILEIPKLIIGKETKISIYNMLAFEQCCYKDRYINDYVFLMNRLINTGKDVDLMIKNGIVQHRLGKDKKVRQFLNKLGEGVMLNSRNFYFSSLCKELNTYSRKRRNIWWANLRQNYFGTPWSIISLVAAVTILILTLIQTVCSVISARSS